MQQQRAASQYNTQVDLIVVYLQLVPEPLLSPLLDTRTSTTTRTKTEDPAVQVQIKKQKPNTSAVSSIKFKGRN